MRHMHSHIRAFVTFHLVALVTIVALLQLQGCSGGSVSQRNKTLTAELSTLNGAAAGFEVWQQDHQHQIVASSTTREESDRRIAEFRNARDLVLDSFRLAYKLLAIAATQADDRSLKDAVVAAAKAVEDAEKLTGGP